jgi:hypothetical protein
MPERCGYRYGESSLYLDCGSVEAIGVHGSTDERGAIKRAIHSPFADLQRRNARALCHDFTPAVSAQLAGGRGLSCQAQVSRVFALTANAAEYLPAGEQPPHSAVEIIDVSQSGNRAAAVSILPGAAAEKHRLQLQMLAAGGRSRPRQSSRCAAIAGIRRSARATAPMPCR